MRNGLIELTGTEAQTMSTPWLTIRLDADGVIDAQVHITDDLTTSDEAVHSIVHAHPTSIPQGAVAALAQVLKDACTPGLARRLQLSKAQTLIAVERNIENKSVLARAAAAANGTVEIIKNAIAPPKE